MSDPGRSANMKITEIRIISLLTLLALGFIAYSQYHAAQNGRYQAVQRENNRMMIIDTRTGKTWDHKPDGLIIEGSSISAQK